jgi:hypothetical protein
MRVVSETGAYEGFLPSLWPLLPVSAVIEMAAVTVFAANLVLTFLQPPAHIRQHVLPLLGRNRGAPPREVYEKTE